MPKRRLAADFESGEMLGGKNSIKHHPYPEYRFNDKSKARVQSPVKRHQTSPAHRSTPFKSDSVSSLLHSIYSLVHICASLLGS